ncbi:IS630 family transposase [Vibrio cholerae]|nr:IS630 family transposase [Vibrio cholerae]HDL9432032.1 IS630 family transposase [Vibrio cholerae]
MKIILTPQQKQQFEEIHDSTRDGRVRDRIKAVLLVFEGWSQVMISQALRIHESTIALHLRDYVLSEKLKPENGGSQSRLNIIGALPLQNIGGTVTETYDTINSESVVRPFWKLKKEHYPLEQKVHLVLDGTAYHQSEMVRNAARVLNMKLHYLPPYSPYLNPIERLWKVMNKYVRNNIYFSSKAEFTTAINEFFNVTLSKVAGSLVSRIIDNLQILKPESSS